MYQVFMLLRIQMLVIWIDIEYSGSCSERNVACIARVGVLNSLIVRNDGIYLPN